MNFYWGSGVYASSQQELFTAGELPGFVHTCIGQEATAAGVCAALTTGDYITSTHRGHGHCIAKGVASDALLAEHPRHAGVLRLAADDGVRVLARLRITQKLDLLASNDGLHHSDEGQRATKAKHHKKKV